MSKKVLWKDVRHRREAWAHTQARLVDDRDIVVCQVCGDQTDLGFGKASAMRAFTRKHFYKCVPNFVLPATGPLFGPRGLFDA